MDNDLENYKEEFLHSKSNKIKWFGEGEWTNEPDLIKFIYKNHEVEIYRIVKNESDLDGKPCIFGGYLVGYIKVNQSDNYYGKKIFDINIDVYGGISYSKCLFEHWIGFDCAHFCDIVPTFNILAKELNCVEYLNDHPDLLNYSPLARTYKNVDFCIQECKKVVDQLIEVKKDDETKMPNVWMEFRGDLYTNSPPNNKGL